MRFEEAKGGDGVPDHLDHSDIGPNNDYGGTASISRRYAAQEEDSDAKSELSNASRSIADASNFKKIMNH